MWGDFSPDCSFTDTSASMRRDCSRSHTRLRRTRWVDCGRGFSPDAGCVEWRLPSQGRPYGDRRWASGPLLPPLLRDQCDQASANAWSPLKPLLRQNGTPQTNPWVIRGAAPGLS
ncbi:hypothetical protein GGR71_001895 [Xanthomonas sp. F1]